MKKIVLLLVLFAVIFSCDKNDDKNCSGLDCLPPATKTGAGTFGCLVNGVPFVDKSGSYNCFYQLVDGEYYFGIGARSKVFDLQQINIGSLKKNVVINEDVPLNGYVDNEFYAEITHNKQTRGAWTTLESDGIINFKRFDMDENIASATFSFIIIDEFVNRYEITEGRFDTHFTQ